MNEINQRIQKKTIAIIGGGITGLGAAWELEKNSQTELSYTMLESSGRWGGKVVTKTVSGPQGGQFTIDGGPESFITRKPEVWEIAHEIGIQDRIIDPGSETRNMFVLERGKPVEIPLNPVSFLSSSLMTTRGKLRMLGEPFMPAKRDDQDESLASFVTRRLGEEALEKFIGPVLAGIYNTDPNTQSILVTSPVMREMEKNSGSLFVAAIGRMLAARKNGANGSRPRFITFKYGAQDLVDHCIEQLSGDLRLNTKVINIQKSNDYYRLELSTGDSLRVDAIILATPANVSAKLLTDVAPAASKGLAQIRHENIGTISLAYKDEDIPSGIEINGLMVPRREKRAIDAITFTSRKLSIRASKGYTLLRVFFGGSSSEMVTLNNEALLSKVQQELNDILGIKANPVTAITFRWPESFPQADVGHLERVKNIKNVLPNGIYLAGSSYCGIGVPDCIRQGRTAARVLSMMLNKRSAREIIS